MRADGGPAPAAQRPRPSAPDGPRERLRTLGLDALADAELLALVIGSGVPGHDASAIARDLLARSPLRELARRGVRELRRGRGIGDVTAARLAAAFEIGRRCAGQTPARGDVVRHPGDLADYLMARFGDQRHEYFGLVLLDGRNRFLRAEVVSRGGWSSSVVRPREVFRQCLLSAAPAIILFHNHPSGDPTPSREDVAITRQLLGAGDLLGIRVLDHLIVAAEGFASLRDRGLM